MDLNDKKTAYAFTSLRANEHFRRVIDAIRDEAQGALEEMAYTTDEAEVRIAQGRYRALADLLSDIERAPDVYEKLQRSNKG